MSAETSHTRTSLQRLLEASAILLSVYFAGLFLYVALQRIVYPFQLEWIEGGTLDVVARLREGLPYYAKPSIEYTPYMYTPLYYYVSAAFSYVFGIDFLAARMVSLLSILGCAALLFLWLRKEGASLACQCLAAGLLLATYRLSGKWFETARVDSFFLFLVLAAGFAFFHGRDLRSAIASGLLLALAFFTKQPALAIAAALYTGGLIADWRRALAGAAAFAACAGLGALWLQWVSDGWFWFFSFELPAAYPNLKYMIVQYWTKDVLRPKLLLFSLLGLTGALLMLLNAPRRALLYLAYLGGLVLYSYGSRIHYGGWNNVLMPLHAALALGAALGVHLMSRMRAKHDPARVAYLAGLAMAVAQLWMLKYPIAPMLPTERHLAAEQKLLDYIQQFPGDVYMPDYRFAQTRVGKRSFGSPATLNDIRTAKLQGKNGQIKKEYVQGLRQAIREQRFDAVILSQHGQLPELLRYYYFKETLYGRGAPHPFAGLDIRPTHVYLPRLEMHRKTD